MNNNAGEETVIQGIIGNVTFRNPVNGYTVLEMNINGQLITAVGVIGECITGEELELTGNWVNNPTYGKQFSFTNVKRTMPETEEKIFRYLAGGAVKGIGPKLAARITQRFGEDTADILENHPDKLATISGISASKAVSICSDFKKNFAMRRILIELENYGITPSECTEIYRMYGQNSMNIIRANPYLLCETVTGFTFDRCEALIKVMGLDPDPVFRQTGGILHIVKHNAYQGHTCIPRDKLLTVAEEFLDIDNDTASTVLDRMLETRKLITGRILERDFIYLPDLYVAEMKISQKLKFFNKFPPSYVNISDNDIRALEKKNNISYAEKQKQAIITAVEKGLLILTGGPGTGKTTTIRGIIDYLEARGLEIKLCAPTGRAAKRLSEVTDREATTIHRLLEVEFDEREKAGFARNADNPIVTGVLIIDEMSMVDTELCASLLDAVPIGCRIIMVGDSDQLPSVGPGNILNDIITSGVIPVVCLTEIFRQAQQSLIVMNAHALIENKPMDLTKKDSDFFLIRKTNGKDCADLICDLVSRRLPDAYGLDSTDGIQVLCPSKKGECGTQNLNSRLQEILNPKIKGKNQIKGPFDRVFREGDKVMQIKNNYNITWKKGWEDGQGIFNGDIGIIEKINLAAGTITINFDDRITEYPSESLAELDFAYAITIHKSQGSEYPAVIIPVIDCPPKLMYRNLLYTGITRAKSLIILTGSEEKIIRMSNEIRQQNRYSGLKFYLSEER